MAGMGTVAEGGWARVGGEGHGGQHDTNPELACASAHSKICT